MIEGGGGNDGSGGSGSGCGLDLKVISYGVTLKQQPPPRHSRSRPGVSFFFSAVDLSICLYKTRASSAQSRSLLQRKVAKGRCSASDKRATAVLDSKDRHCGPYSHSLVRVLYSFSGL